MLLIKYTKFYQVQSLEQKPILLTKWSSLDYYLLTGLHYI